MKSHRKGSELTPKEIFHQHGGALRTTKAVAAGIPARTLYSLYEAGVIEQVSRGLYRLKDLGPIEAPDLFTVAKKIPNGVVCLISALAFHGLTTQIPREVDVALKKGSEKPRLTSPPIKFYWISDPAFSAGIETHTVDGALVRVYSVEKTLADCFKFRNRIGQDLCIEALKEWKQRKRPDVKALLHYARICRVEKVIRPYLEALS